MNLLMRPAANYATSAWLCGLIQCLRQPNPLEACIAYVLPETGIGVQVRAFPATDVLPAFGCLLTGEFPQRTVIFIDGASRIEHVQSLVDAYTGNIQSGYNDPTNNYLGRAAALIQGQIENSGLTVSASFTLAGFSLGGAIGPRLLNQYVLRQGRGLTSECVTYGAPRCVGVTERRNLSANMDVTRWMVPTDPISLTPPRVADFPSLPLIIGVRPSLRWGNFCHPEGGVEIDAFGEVSRVEVPSLASVNMAISLANWVWSVINDVRTDHNMDVYRVRLQIAARTQRTHTRPPVAPAEQPQGAIHQVLNIAERRAQQQLVALEHRQNAVPINIPKPDRFKHQKIGKLHYVTFRDVVLATGTRKSKTIAIARDMNDMLRRLQTMGIVDTEAWIKSFTTYLNEAGDPAGEFTPVMQTNWNIGAT